MDTIREGSFTRQGRTWVPLRCPNLSGIIAGRKLARQITLLVFMLLNTDIVGGGIGRPSIDLHVLHIYLLTVAGEAGKTQWMICS